MYNDLIFWIHCIHLSYTFYFIIINKYNLKKNMKFCNQSSLLFIITHMLQATLVFSSSERNFIGVCSNICRLNNLFTTAKKNFVKNAWYFPLLVLENITYIKLINIVELFSHVQRFRCLIKFVSHSCKIFNIFIKLIILNIKLRWMLLVCLDFTKSFNFNIWSKLICSLSENGFINVNM